MATTNQLTRDAEYLIYRAFRLLKKVRPGDTMEADELTGALEVLQDMMRNWQNGDTPTHKRTAITVALVAGQGMYELNSLGRVRDVHHARLVYTDNFEIQLTTMNAVDYLSMPTKETNGVPSQYWFDRSPSSHIIAEPASDTSADAAKIYLWPRPDTTVVANGGLLQLRVSVPYEVPTLLTDPMDIPQEWYEAVAYCLAKELYTEYGGNADVIPLAMQKWQDVLDGDRPSYVEIVMAGR